MAKTPSSMDTQLESDTSTTPSSQHLQLPQTDISHKYPGREATSSYSRSTASSLAKYKVYFIVLSILSICFHFREDQYQRYDLIVN
jgi:hypothetical protein